MRDELEPVAGNWYTHHDKGQTFQVVAVDEDREVIEIQYFDGDLEEIDTDAWYDMDLEIAEPPEDERGLDDDRTDDGRLRETAMSDRASRDELEANRSESEEWEDEDDEDDEDDDEDEDDEDEDQDDRGRRGSSDERYEE